jgi:class 3 adenylate cyclase
MALQAGLHVGEIDIRDPDLDGPTIRRATCVMSQCKSGEVLVSRVVADLAAGAGLNFTERGPAGSQRVRHGKERPDSEDR